MTKSVSAPTGKAPELPDSFIDGLGAIVGVAHVRTGEAIHALDYGTNPANLGAGAMVSPATTGEVAEIVKLCGRHRVSIVPQGGRTGLVGGSTAERSQIVLSTGRMNEVEPIEPVDRVAVVGAGATLQSVQDAAARHRLDPGIDIAARGSATIGGMISTNAGGVMAFRNGVMRHRILGLEAVMADGAVYSDMTRVVKNAAGYDLKHLFIGGEGTLGIVTRAVLALEPMPGATATALFGLPSVAAVMEMIRLGLDSDIGHLRAAEALWKSYIGLTAGAHGWAEPGFNLDYPIYLLLSLGGGSQAPLQDTLAALYEEMRERHGDIIGVVAGSARQEADLWRLREDTDLLYRTHREAPSYDVSVPLSAIDAYAQRVRDGLAAIDADLDPYMFGHLADGNLHIVLNRAGPLDPGLSQRIEAVLYGDLAALGGSFSAEHGVGSKRIHALAATADATKLETMRTAKRMLDPLNLFNPGKLFEDIVGRK